ncbi:uncharacterized protein SOCE26_026760 [Sorangium cellulosum]|uniref:Uncharacterized protein n=1 Tax=Sorangium cellulosum TaxID=56 RepID=A0A2L0EPQ1_SORCE|nr:uncharacterized protein SOCE26_026760 [Sorangium cellulosum]
MKIRIVKIAAVRVNDGGETICATVCATSL